MNLVLEIFFFFFFFFFLLKVAQDESSAQKNVRASYAEVILESGASVELASKVKVEINLLDQLKADTVKDRSIKKFSISVIDFIVMY